MGIDIYMRWTDQTEEEVKAQYTGFSTIHGHAGYLREAYHGSPYATHYLVEEAFDEDAPEEGASIPCAILRERLPETLNLHIQRCKEIYNENIHFESPSAEAFIAFVELAERLTAKGKSPTIIASY